MSFARKLQREKGKKAYKENRQDWFIRTVPFKFADDHYVIASQHRDFSVSLVRNKVPTLSEGCEFLACIKCSSPLSLRELGRLVNTYVFHEEKLKSRIIEVNTKVESNTTLNINV